jgi:acetyl-CoA C-acetyltransferase
VDPSVARQGREIAEVRHEKISRHTALREHTSIAAIRTGDLMTNSVITGFARTAIGRFGGGFQPLQAVDLGAAAIRGALERTGIDGAQVDEVVMGHVIQAGTGQITSRQAAVNAGIPMTVPATTVNKVCLSGMTAIAMVDRSIRLGESSIAVAGGMESMTNAPYVVPNARWGARIGDTTMLDSMQHDGLWCAFDQCTMGERADGKNSDLGIDRATQDAWSAESHRRAAAATESGHFAREIVPVEVPQRRGDPIVIDTDEGIRAGVTAKSLGDLRAAFTEDGTTTAGNASQISDGGAAMVVMSRTAADAIGAPINAEILAYGQIGGVDPTLHERPAEAIKVALKRAELTTTDLDVIEINEAFASVAYWSSKMLDLDIANVNPNGGGVALGHPIGCTGARLMVSLIHELQRRGGGIGAAALCGGGGQGDALIVKV